MSEIITIKSPIITRKMVYSQAPGVSVNDAKREGDASSALAGMFALAKDGAFVSGSNKVDDNAIIAGIRVKATLSAIPKSSERNLIGSILRFAGFDAMF